MKKVFFTGHRQFTANFEETYKASKIIAEFVREGITDFYAGGARGWDMKFSNMVLIIRDKYFPYVKLHLILPCPPYEQTEKWNTDDKEV